MRRIIPYALAREIDDFCRGSALDGTEFWVKVVSEPEIGDKHMTTVDVMLAQETEQGLEPIGQYTIKAWPSVLDEFDRHLMMHAHERPDWVYVVYECFDGRKGQVRRMKIHGERDGTLTRTPPQPTPTGPSKPAATVSEASLADDSGSERGKPGAGGLTKEELEYAHSTLENLYEDEPPADPCQHLEAKLQWNEPNRETKSFYCKDCGERVG